MVPPPPPLRNEQRGSDWSPQREQRKKKQNMAKYKNKLSLWNRLVVAGGGSFQSSRKKNYKSIGRVFVCVHSIYFCLDVKKLWFSVLRYCRRCFCTHFTLCSSVGVFFFHPLGRSPCAARAHTMWFIWWLQNSIRPIPLFHCVSHTFAVHRSSVEQRQQQRTPNDSKRKRKIEACRSGSAEKWNWESEIVINNNNYYPRTKSPLA